MKSVIIGMICDGKYKFVCSHCDRELFTPEQALRAKICPRCNRAFKNYIKIRRSKNDITRTI